MGDRVAAAVVTYNRKRLLRDSLGALLGQTADLGRLLVVDNASTDGTEAMLREEGWLANPAVVYCRLEENLGGAGGFRAALERLVAEGYDWIWLMDDDALPEPGALAALLAASQGGAGVYGSAAVADNGDPDDLCWPAELLEPNGSGRTILHHSQLPALALVVVVPFLGFFIHQSWVTRVGFPEAGYFLSGDDAEYCTRLRRAGADIFIVKASRIRHPMPPRRVVSLFGRTITVLAQAPWRRYYDVRNRLLIARAHHGARLWTEALPGTLLRWVVTLVSQEGRWPQSRAYALGIWHGLRGTMGIRWRPGA